MVILVALATIVALYLAFWAWAHLTNSTRPHTQLGRIATRAFNAIVVTASRRGAQRRR